MSKEDLVLSTGTMVSTNANRRSMFTTAVTFVATTALALSLTACGDTSKPAASGVISDAQQQLYDEAMEAGGRAKLFIGTASNEETDQLISIFNETYPDVTVEYVSGVSSEVTERLLTEKRAGLHNVDALILGGISTYNQVVDEGYMSEFTPEDAPLFAEEGTYVDSKVYSFAGQFNGVCYNPNNVTDEEIQLLKTYDGWVDPVWKGRAAIVNADSAFYQRGLSYWLYQDKELGQAWLEKLAALDPVVASGANVLVPQTIAGEYDVVFNVATVFGARAHRDGAPLQCTTAERAPYSTMLVGTVKEAPNEAAGKLFANWLFSEAGQAAVQETWSFSALRKGFNAPVTDADWWTAPEDPRIVDEQLLNNRHSELVVTINKLFGGAK